MAQTGKRLEKIKVTDEEVEIHYSVPKKGDIRDLVSVKSEDRPIPQFRMALQAFDQYVRRLCEWPETVKGEDSGISVSIVHISYNDKGVRSIIVTAKKELAGSNGPFCFNTPLVTEEEDSKYFDSETSEKLGELMKQANAYLDGERLQGELKFDEKGKKGEKAKSDKEEKTPLKVIPGTKD